MAAPANASWWSWRTFSVAERSSALLAYLAIPAACPVLRPPVVSLRASARMPCAGAAASIAGSWQSPAGGTDFCSVPSTFAFSEHGHCCLRGRLGRSAVAEKLWRYNLHYFDDLNAAGGESRLDWQHAADDGLDCRKPAAGRNGMGALPDVAAYRELDQVGTERVTMLSSAWVQSLAVQARWLSGRLECHLLGNHSVRQCQGAGLCRVCFSTARRPEPGWTAGLHILDREVPEQVLSDGGHFERSTLYHALAWRMCLISQLLATFENGLAAGERARAVRWREAAGRMLEWLQGMSHPDGQIGFFNDAALGIAADPAALRAYAERVGIIPAVEEAPAFGSLHMRCWRDSGYIRLESSDAVALLDVAPVGPDYLPGHAHADTLSFELSVFWPARDRQWWNVPLRTWPGRDCANGRRLAIARSRSRDAVLPRCGEDSVSPAGRIPLRCRLTSSGKHSRWAVPMTDSPDCRANRSTGANGC